MSAQETSSTRQGINYGSPVHLVGRSERTKTITRAILAVIVALVMMIPIYWMATTAFKSRADAITSPPKFVFEPTLEGFVQLLTERAIIPAANIDEALANADQLNWVERIALQDGSQITGVSRYVSRLKNSVIIAGGSTLLAVVLGVLAAYAFSRFPVPGENDLLFFILSQRMLPAVVVTIPLFLFYREVGLYDTHLGMILLYTSFNLSLSVWLLKGFIDEIPKQYEEAALVDGYTRLQAFRKVVLPNAVTGIAATAVFCLIFAWNEYAFALMMSSDRARTPPPSITSRLGRGGMEWAAVAAGSMAFLIPVVIVTFALRNYLLRGVTFGAIRQ